MCFCIALFVIAKVEKQISCPSTCDWLDKVWYFHAIECYTNNKMYHVDTCIRLG